MLKRIKSDLDTAAGIMLCVAAGFAIWLGAAYLVMNLT